MSRYICSYCKEELEGPYDICRYCGCNNKPIKEWEEIQEMVKNADKRMSDRLGINSFDLDFDYIINKKNSKNYRLIPTKLKLARKH